MTKQEKVNQLLSAVENLDEAHRKIAAVWKKHGMDDFSPMADAMENIREQRKALLEEADSILDVNVEDIPAVGNQW